MPHSMTVFCLILLSILWPPLSADVASQDTKVTGSMIIAGRGPERAFIERAAEGFERSHLGTAVEIQWGRTFNPEDMVKSGEADLAVTDTTDSELTVVPIAWDGIAVIVNFANPVKELSSSQLRQILTGSLTAWSELHEQGAGPIELIKRPDDQHLNRGLQQSLNLTETDLVKAPVLRSDQSVLSRVSGRLGAVSYLSLGGASEAVTYGSPIRILLLDGIEPAKPTVASGAYKLRRPVVLMAREPNVVAQAFVDFLTSPAGHRIIDEFYVPYR